MGTLCAIKLPCIWELFLILTENKRTKSPLQGGDEMIEILQNKENLDKIEFNARDGEEVLGSIAGVLDGEVFVVDELDCEDFFTDGLVRAILNLMSLHGIDKARFELPESDLWRLRRLRFFSGEPKMESINAFFDQGCKSE